MTKVTEPTHEMDELFDLEVAPTGGEIRDPGLHPGFQFFMSNLLAEYLACAPGRINALLSGYDLIFRQGLTTALRNAKYARAMFLDSGAISPLMACMRDKVTPQDVHTWLDRTDELVALAWQIHEAGSPPGVLAAMDLPAYARMLEPAGITVEQGEAITMKNAELMMEQVLPPGWRPVFTSQGVTLDDHRRCMAAYQANGVLGEVRAGRAWLAVGGMAFETQPDRVRVIHQEVREILGDGHIHGLGVGRLEVLVPLVRRGLIDSADVSSPFQEVRYNRGPFMIPGMATRPSFLVYALHAAAALRTEAELAVAIRRADRIGDHEQGAFPWL